MDSSSPISVQLPDPSPKTQPLKKSFVTSLMEATALRTPSFKEDTYLVTQLRSSERKSLQELKDRLLASHGSDSMWGIPLLGENQKADVILLKFLRARDFRVSDSLQMLVKCLTWTTTTISRVRSAASLESTATTKLPASDTPPPAPPC